MNFFLPLSFILKEGMKFKHLLVAAALIAAIPAFSQEKALRVITREVSEIHMKYLSSDSLEGGEPAVMATILLLNTSVPLPSKQASDRFRVTMVSARPLNTYGSPQSREARKSWLKTQPATSCTGRQ